MKLTAFIGENLMLMIDIIEEILYYENQPGNKLMALARYCCYDVRNRTNYAQFAQEILLS